MEELRYNAMDITSAAAFARIKGGTANGRRDIYFIRLTGTCSSYRSDIENMDRILCGEEAQGRCVYRRISSFPKITGQEDIGYYLQRYDEWQASGFRRLQTKTITEQEKETARRVSAACREICGIYRSFHGNVSEHMERNFAIKLLFWMDTVGADFLSPAGDGEKDEICRGKYSQGTGVSVLLSDDEDGCGCPAAAVCGGHTGISCRSESVCLPSPGRDGRRVISASLRSGCVPGTGRNARTESAEESDRTKKRQRRIGKTVSAFRSNRHVRKDRRTAGRRAGRSALRRSAGKKILKNWRFSLLRW